MNFNTNKWNRIRYTLYLPIYDLIGNIFAKSRQQSIELLDIKESEKVLLIGAGTGIDIIFIPSGAQITATDITPSMVKKIDKRFGENVNAVVMDGQKLNFPDHNFDKVILHLILAVIPDPYKCLKEVERVLKPGGTVAVFDKFLEDDQEPGFLRRIFNTLTSFLFSDINRKLNEIIKDTSFIVDHKEKANFNGVFKIYTLKNECIK